MTFPPVIYPLPSIVEPLDLAQLFPASQPLEVELGSGDGSFLARYAAEHRERNFIGVERLLGRLRKIERKCQRAGFTHVRGIRIEAAYFLEWLLPLHSVEAVHVYFPDPWPKRKHRKNRLVNDRFTELARRVLVPSGLVYVRTDDADYFSQMQSVFAASPHFQPVTTPDDLANIHTDFERNFRARGVSTLSAAYQVKD